MCLCTVVESSMVKYRVSGVGDRMGDMQGPGEERISSEMRGSGGDVI
ncbi:unnamed protein product [Staurois parvus]|uniref:Uncharacterized protein n=1 Tax=Staurois parvus TaxID=386267 RepID=A0ABN9BZW0_9NEOB|nr:unnamed protein product [Staurois parvus]